MHELCLAKCRRVNSSVTIEYRKELIFLDPVNPHDRRQLFVFVARAPSGECRETCIERLRDVLQSRIFDVLCYFLRVVKILGAEIRNLARLLLLRYFVLDKLVHARDLLLERRDQLVVLRQLLSNLLYPLFAVRNILGELRLYLRYLLLRIHKSNLGGLVYHLECELNILSNLLYCENVANYIKRKFVNLRPYIPTRI